MSAPAPLIVTADLPPDLQAMASGLRRAHFPPERNHLDAHVTLFHALPPSVEAELVRLLVVIAGEEGAPPGRLEGVMSLGRGTALRLASPALLRVRDRIAETFHGALSAQDNHRPRLHVTVQNKVEPAVARALQAELEASVRPRDFAFTGLSLHRYRGGPWEFVRRFAFRGNGG